MAVKIHPYPFQGETITSGSPDIKSVAVQYSKSLLIVFSTDAGTVTCNVEGIPFGSIPNNVSAISGMSDDIAGANASTTTQAALGGNTAFEEYLVTFTLTGAGSATLNYYFVALAD